jgi:hypothetical protein
MPEEWALTSRELKGLLLWEQMPEEEADIPKERAHSLGVYFGNKHLRRRWTFPKKELTLWAFTSGTPEEQDIPEERAYSSSVYFGNT